MLDSAPLGLEGLVVSMLAQAGQEGGLVDPGVGAQGLCDEGCKPRVAPCQPPPWGHSVGLVLEFLRSELIEVLDTQHHASSYCVHALVSI